MRTTEDRALEQRAQMNADGYAENCSSQLPFRVIVDPFMTLLETLKAELFEALALRAEHERSFGRPFSLAVIAKYGIAVAVLALGDVFLNASALGLLFQHAPVIGFLLSLAIALATFVTSHFCGRWLRDKSRATQTALYGVLIFLSIGILAGTYNALAASRVTYLSVVEATENDVNEQSSYDTAPQATLPDTGAQMSSIFLYMNAAMLVCGIFLSVGRHSCPEELEAATIEAERLKREFGALAAQIEADSTRRADSARDLAERRAARERWEKGQ
jgi:hypothetical protein